MHLKSVLHCVAWISSACFTRGQVQYGVWKTIVSKGTTTYDANVNTLKLFPPLDGVWTPWAVAGPCSVTCGSSGTVTRVRSCQLKQGYGVQDCDLEATADSPHRTQAVACVGLPDCPSKEDRCQSCQPHAHYALRKLGLLGAPGQTARY